MATHGEGRNWLARSGPGALAVIAVGGLLGYIFSTSYGDIFEVPVSALLINYALGVIWAFLFLEWVDAIFQGLGFFADPLPRGLDLGRREELKAHAEKVCGLKELVARSRHLLECWIAGYKPRDLIALAAFQSDRARAQLRPGGLLILLLLAPCLWFQRESLLAWAGLAMLALTFYVRSQLLGRIDHYIEVRFLARLPTLAPGTAVTGAELGDILGQAVNSAFKKYIPQPEQMATAISGAVDRAGRTAAEELERIQKAFVDNQTSILDKIRQSEDATLKPLQEAQKSLAAVAGDLTDGFRTGTDKLNDILKGQGEALKAALSGAAAQIQQPITSVAQELRNTLSQHGQQISSAGAGWKDQLGAVLNDHATKLQAANQTLATQLDKITALGKEIEKVLHVQEAVDKTVKAVTTTEEFQKTLADLRTHLQASDNLLREMSKPRTIQLVESESGEG